MIIPSFTAIIFGCGTPEANARLRRIILRGRACAHTRADNSNGTSLLL
jgi:hypothetical protein